MRCNACARWLRFVGIVTVPRLRGARVDTCDHCKQYLVSGGRVIKPAFTAGEAPRSWFHSDGLV